MSTTLRKAGFTLVELMVVMVVTTVMIVVIMAFFLNNLARSSQESTKAQILSEVQSTLDAVSTDIRLSSNADATNRNPDANSPSGGPTGYGWQSNASTLVLVTAAKTANHQMIFSDAANYITAKNNIVYFVSDGTLYKRIIADTVSGNAAVTTCPASKVTGSCPADKVMLHNVSNFSVSYVDASNNTVTPANARAVQISLAASKTSYRETVSASYTTRMVFRND